MVKFWRVLVVCVLLALTINIRVNFRCSFVDISPNASRRKALPHEGNYSGSERISTPGADSSDTFACFFLPANTKNQAHAAPDENTQMTLLAAAVLMRKSLS